MNLDKIELIKDGKKKEYKLKVFTARLYSKCIEILKEIKQSEFEIKALELATEFEKSKDLEIAKQMINLQNQSIDVELELHNYLVYCKLLENLLDTNESFDEDFWLEQDKTLIEEFIVFFRKTKKLTRN
jgi:hypothetical protein